MWSLGVLAAAAAAAVTANAPERGVPLALARERAARVSNVRYVLAFDIPSSTASAVTGKATISFDLKDDRPLALDFRRPPGTALRASAPYREVDEHLVLDGLRRGRNTVSFAFTANSAPLNRDPDYLYTLLVPARAREVFPCFDQPDLKASFELTLSVPAGWQAVGNGPELERKEAEGRSVVAFGETRPMSTYLFAFAAGKFSVETARRGGRVFRIFHREDEKKAARSLDALFDLTAGALAWMEEYTGIDYPWGKLDMVYLPAFQYAGMEHPGAIFYNSRSQFLDEDPTEEELLKRAATVAHEIAHMWFGDLVTMKWFDDVWLKEVFAGFMAAKIVEPRFPRMDHALRFLMSHQPRAYEVDATRGAHPVLQPLDNLNAAGLLYGYIIYCKAPVVMKQLELLIGEAAMRAGLRDYLSKFAFGNAAWADLVALLEKRAGKPLGGFSRSWVLEAGRPVVETDWSARDGAISSLTVRQSDPSGRGRLWPQALETALYYADGSKAFPVALSAAAAEVPGAAGLPEPAAVLPERGGYGYAEFRLDEKSRRWLLANVSQVREASARGQVWLALWDDVLSGRLTAARYLEALELALPRESVELNAQYLLRTAEQAHWRFLSDEERAARAADWESVLWRRLESAAAPSLKKALARAYWKTAVSPAATAKLRALWDGSGVPPGLTVSEDDRAQLALELALRGVDVVDQELARITNADRRERLGYLKTAAAGDEAARDAFFAGLSQPANRLREAWVEEALELLHHPLRQKSSVRYVRPALEALEDIQRTGDIFFPHGWVAKTLKGHSSPEAAAAVKDFLSERPSYPAALRRLILEALFPLESAARTR